MHDAGRRKFIKGGVGAGTVGLLLSRETRADRAEKLAEAMNAPVLKKDLFAEPVVIESIELLRSGKHYLVRARSKNGAVGLAGAHDSVTETAFPILLRRVIPYFIGRDARELDSLIHGVYLHSSNYKWQGLPFWACVAGVELALLDLLGKIASKPVGELIGKVVRGKIPVYRASGNRGNSPDQEIDFLRRIVEETGASAIKFRLGARMRYDDASTRRDLAMIPLTRKVFGDGMTIYADANGSYDVPMSIRIGRLMEEQKFAFLEEPVPFDYYEETKEVADKLAIPVAGGEQESSLRRFRWMIEHDVVQVVQPDLFYFGGLTRSVRVARMAQAAGIDCTAHMSGGGLGYLYVAHFASCIPNPGPHQEYKGDDDTIPVSSPTSSLKSDKGMLAVPTGPGLGIEFEPSFLKSARTVTV